jgi:hypothetical protein
LRCIFIGAALAAHLCGLLVPHATAQIVSGSTASNYPIQQQPGIWPPEAPQVNSYTPPAGYPMATEYFYALKDIYNPAPATVELDWMEVHAIVNGQDVIVVRNDYGVGGTQQQTVSGDLTLRSDMTSEVPGNVASGWTSNAVVMDPGANISYADSAWNDVPGLVPAGATDVYVEARVLVTGSAVAQVGLDYWNSALTTNVNGAFSGFQILANPSWQIVTLGEHPLITCDVNQDGIVNGQDLAVVASDWLQIGIAPPGDANLDGIVNGQDIALIASNWLRTVGGGTGGAAAVPEPSTFILAALGGLALVARRRRRWQSSRG